MHHRPCEWFRVIEYLRIGSCAGACRGGRADRRIKQSDRIMKQPKDKHKAEANCERYMANIVSAKQKSIRAREAALVTLFAQSLQTSSRAAGQLGSAELVS